MAELSFITIIVSLAVCSLLTYAIFQYMKVRLSILEQSHKEQAMILQQYIEESSTDIHRLYQMTTSPSNARQMHQTGGSIILEYANDFNRDGNSDDKQPQVSVYNEPHTIHLDTAFFQNNRSSKLIEISSDSEDTTESGSGSGSGSGSDSSDSDDSSESSESSESSDSDIDHHPDVNHAVDASDSTEIVDTPTTEIKTVSVDLGIPHDLEAKSSPVMDVLSMLYKKAQDNTPSVVDVDVDVANFSQDSVNDSQSPADAASASAPADTAPAPAPAAATIPTTNVPLSAMSVTELKNLLKEKCKHQPEKHAEIQRLKKAELIYAIQQLQ